MTEVPEYLLERSRARRAALGLPTTGAPPAEGSSPPPPSDEGGDATPAVAAASSVPSTETAPTAAAVAIPPPAPVEQLPAYMLEPGRRTGIPAWMMPVLLLLPLWGIVYMGVFGESTASGEVNGAQIFSQRCASCHGARGAGGIGPKLAGEVTLTFPVEADHIAFVKSGSDAIKGQPYGDPGRPGGQRTAKSGGMPPFESLAPEALAAVVKFEREGL